MKLNMGVLDRVLRVIAALAVLGLFLGGIIKGGLAIVLLIAAGIFILTGFVGFCPLYTLFGWSTCKRK